MRHHLSFTCDGAALAATLDDAPGSTGLLIVSGGNEVRCGAHRGMATLAERVSLAGYAVFRFDRRGIGDSEGTNGGFGSSGPDIAAAITAFRGAAPHVSRIVAFGNCDAASALLLHRPLALDGLVIANPWTYDSHGDERDEAALPPPSAIRARYLSRLRDPRSLLRLFRGEVDFRKLFRGLSALKQTPQARGPNSLANRLDGALAERVCPVTILLATGDRTARAFVESCGPTLASIEKTDGPVRVVRLASSSHSFAGDDGDWLAQQILAALSAQAAAIA